MCNSIEIGEVWDVWFSNLCEELIFRSILDNVFFKEPFNTYVKEEPFLRLASWKF